MFSLLLLFEMQRKDLLFLLKIPAVYKLLFTASEGQTQIYWTVTINYGGNDFLVFIGQGKLSGLCFLFFLHTLVLKLFWILMYLA